jgi:PBP1b-binding outer membrane lipoprotein LpoB
MTAALLLVLMLLLAGGCVPTSTTVDPDTPTEPQEAVESEPVEKPAEPEVTMGQKQAVEKAHQYLEVSAFSRQGLIEQLVYEGFTTDEATFAVDFLGTDWRKQAAAKAERYLDLTAFSRQGLIDQLVFDGFTTAEAEYGVTAVGY